MGEAPHAAEKPSPWPSPPEYRGRGDQGRLTLSAGAGQLCRHEADYGRVGLCGCEWCGRAVGERLGAVEGADEDGVRAGRGGGAEDVAGLAAGGVAFWDWGGGGVAGGERREGVLSRRAGGEGSRTRGGGGERQGGLEGGAGRAAQG